MQEAIPGEIRQLSQDDQGIFAEFCAGATEEDLDAAYVELDHWLVFGAFEQERLVCAGSMYAWMDSDIADFGMLTLPPFRGKGHGRRLVRAISQTALQLGFPPSTAASSTTKPPSPPPAPQACSCTDNGTSLSNATNSSIRIFKGVEQSDAKMCKVMHISRYNDKTMLHGSRCDHRVLVERVRQPVH
ncbi:GNAT family N-acetyltransferase [Massilia sp. MB5]|uniref:GNAT family N-acetyltransferase n=1 Tax=Massilia sp. MB5 TaxID=2919578 RepID=UPI0035A33E47